MSLVPSDLAAVMATGIGQSTVTSQLVGFATAIIDELTQNGVAAVGEPAGNTISGMSASDLAHKITTGIGQTSPSSEITGFATAIVTHIESATVSYTGPGPTPPDFFTGGTIIGLSGPTLTNLVQADAGYPSQTSELTGMCDAICTYITANAQVTSGVIS